MFCYVALHECFGWFILLIIDSEETQITLSILLLVPYEEMFKEAVLLFYGNMRKFQKFQPRFKEMTFLKVEAVMSDVLKVLDSHACRGGARGATAPVGR